MLENNSEYYQVAIVLHSTQYLIGLTVLHRILYGSGQFKDQVYCFLNIFVGTPIVLRGFVWVDTKQIYLLVIAFARKALAADRNTSLSHGQRSYRLDCSIPVLHAPVLLPGNIDLNCLLCLSLSCFCFWPDSVGLFKPLMFLCWLLKFIMISPIFLNSQVIFLGILVEDVWTSLEILKRNPHKGTLPMMDKKLV
jgi:hypothetical protein